MQIDTAVAMLVYTLATVAFYILGAGVLFGAQKVPAGYDMVRTLSSIYTTTLGPWAFYLFLHRLSYHYHSHSVFFWDDYQMGLRF